MNALDALYIPLAAITAPWWAGKKRAGWRARFGHTPTLQPPTSGKPRVLLHAVSVGEVSALRQLVPLLTPTMDVVISTTTDTGTARATDLFASTCRVVRYPLDFSWACDRFLDAIKPDAIALVELEVWPNFVRRAATRHIPVCIINGRLSERSFKGYNRIKRFFARWLSSLAFVAVQDPDYAARFEALGVHPNLCLLTGSMKWDAIQASSNTSSEALAPGADELARQLGIDRTRPLVVAGSTAPDEHTLIHQAVPPGCQLLVAPRKPEWFDRAAQDLPGCRRLTHTRDQIAPTSPQSSDCFLLDTIGDLKKAYALADVVVIGRSFGNLYGSDPIEPIALGKPVIIGPSVADFSVIVRNFEDAGGIVRSTREELPAKIVELLGDLSQRESLARAGAECIRQQQGASVRHAALLRSLVQWRATPVGAGGSLGG
jgi:3-deoxy-D-manno-octulosonic-acid transferase